MYIILRCMGTYLMFFGPFFLKGDNFFYFLFASLDDETVKFGSV